MCRHNNDFSYWFGGWVESSQRSWGVWKYPALGKGWWWSLLMHIRNKIKVQSEKERLGAVNHETAPRSHPRWWQVETSNNQIIWFYKGGNLYWGSEDFQVLLQVSIKQLAMLNFFYILDTIRFSLLFYQNLEFGFYKSHIYGLFTPVKNTLPNKYNWINTNNESNH